MLTARKLALPLTSSPLVQGCCPRLRNLPVVHHRVTTTYVGLHCSSPLDWGQAKRRTLEHTPWPSSWPTAYLPRSVAVINKTLTPRCAPKRRSLRSSRRVVPVVSPVFSQQAGLKGERGTFDQDRGWHLAPRGVSARRPLFTHPTSSEVAEALGRHDCRGFARGPVADRLRVPHPGTDDRPGHRLGQHDRPAVDDGVDHPPEDKPASTSAS